MLPPDGIELFLRLIFAHLLADFVLQPDSWVDDRSNNGWRSKYLVCHAVMTGGLALLFVNLWNVVLILKAQTIPPELDSQLWIPLLYAFILITVSHYIIDGLKPRLATICQKIRKLINCGKEQKNSESESVCVLTIDQILHLAVLYFVLSRLLYPQTLFVYPFGDPNGIIKIWIVLTAFLLVLWPSGILISRITQVWRTGKSCLTGEACTPLEPDTLDKAGRWIGYVERLLIVAFILAGDYTAIGFLATAKGLFRFNDPKKAEYVIVGTLLSFAIAVLIGAAVNYLVHLGGTEAIDLCFTERLQRL